MYATDFNYVRPNDLRAALSALSEEDSVAIAGGQSLSGYLKHRVVTPRLVVDLAGLEELRGVHREDDGRIRIGAYTTWADLNGKWAGVVPEAISTAAGHVGDTQVRNRGTIGGGMALANPEGEIHSSLVAMDVEIEVAGVDGTRYLSGTEFYIAPFISALEDGEIIVAVRIPAAVRQTKYFPASPRPGDYVIAALSTAAISHQQSETFAVCISAHASTPIRVEELNLALAFEAARRAVASADARSTEAYPDWYRTATTNALIDYAAASLA